VFAEHHFVAAVSGGFVLPIFLQSKFGRQIQFGEAF